MRGALWRRARFYRGRCRTPGDPHWRTRNEHWRGRRRRSFLETCGISSGLGRDKHLLASYEAERRPIGLRNVKASRAAMMGRLGWRAAYDPNVRDNTPEGAATRARMAALFDVEQRKVTEILGIEAGYRYVDSPIIWQEPDDGPDPDNPSVCPDNVAGRAPPARLARLTAQLCTIALGRGIRCSGLAERRPILLVWNDCFEKCAPRSKCSTLPAKERANSISTTCCL